MLLCKKPKEMYLNLLILCLILFKETVGTFAEEDNKESTDLLIREKRVIDNSKDGNQGVIIEDVPYVVQIIIGGSMKCAGSILSPHIVITCAHCVYGLAPSTIHVLSGSASINRGTRHNVTGKIEDPMYRPPRYYDDLIMLIISPPIDIVHSPNRPIELHEGPLPANAHGIVSGWGCIRRSSTGYVYPSRVQSIQVPLISFADCQHLYENRKFITTKNICTLHPHNEKRCSHGDSGAPLVVGGKLVGVHAWNVKQESLNKMNPDVYMSMLNNEYRNWITTSIASHLQHHHEARTVLGRGSSVHAGRPPYMPMQKK